MQNWIERVAITTEGNENPIAIAVVDGEEKSWNGKSECGKTLGGGNRSVGQEESEEKNE